MGPDAAGREESWFWSLTCQSRPAIPASSHSQVGLFPAIFTGTFMIRALGFSCELLCPPPTWTPSSRVCLGAGRPFQYVHLSMSQRGFLGLQTLCWVGGGLRSLSPSLLPAAPRATVSVLLGAPSHLVLHPNSYSSLKTRLKCPSSEGHSRFIPGRVLHAFFCEAESLSVYD